MAHRKITSLTSLLPSLSLHNKRVFLRADLNVPLKNGSIIDDYRLQALLPTIDLIQKKGGKIILATHIGRPKGFDGMLSTQHVLPWFKKADYKITYEADLAAAVTKSYHDFDTILLLENMRFFPGEKNHDPLFAQQLADLGDYYVNDAFALLHRADTSITMVPELFAPNHRTIGLLIEKELAMLNNLLENPAKPFVLILGGGKVADKLPILYSLIDTVDVILLGPAIVCTFLKAHNKPVGKSLVDDTQLESCNQFIVDAHQRNIKIVFPVDYLIAHETFNGSLSYTNADEFPADAVSVSIGPKTAQIFAQEISRAGTIFFNGLMGTTQRPETLNEVNTLFHAMADSSGTSIVGGGDSVAAAQLLNVANSLDFLSTGGGATLAYLAGEDLPGLSVFIDKK
jgi:phosphoglycerate kinase